MLGVIGTRAVQLSQPGIILTNLGSRCCCSLRLRLPLLLLLLLQHLHLCCVALHLEQRLVAVLRPHTLHGTCI